MNPRIPLVLMAVLAVAPAAAATAVREDPYERILGRIDQDGLGAVWRESQELADLGEEGTGRLRQLLDGELSDLGRLAVSRALLELEEVPDARDGLLSLIREDVENPVRISAILLLGSPEFEQDPEVGDRLREVLDESFGYGAPRSGQGPAASARMDRRLAIRFRQDRQLYGVFGMWSRSR